MPVNDNVPEIVFEFEKLSTDAHQVDRLLLFERNTWSQSGMDEEIRSGDEIWHRVSKETRVPPGERRLERMPLRVLGGEEGKPRLHSI